MPRALCSFVPLAVLVSLALPQVAAPATTTKPITPAQIQKMQAAQLKNLHRSQALARKNAQKVYIVQGRHRGSTKTALMTPAAALTTRAKLRSQGFSAHIHNYGAQGALVHYSMGAWRPQGIYPNAQAANQAAAILRANGLSSRVVQR